MQPDLEDLQIRAGEIDRLTGLDISDTFMGRVYRPSVFRAPKRLLSFLLTELLTLGLISVICLPASLIIARNFVTLNQTPQSFLPLVAIAGLISIALFLLWNFYMHWQGRKLKTLAHLLDEIDKYNEIIQAVDLIDELSAVKNSTVAVIDRPQVLQALSAARESLICALMTEKILRNRQRLIARRQELFHHIETNLATLQTLQTNQEANQYSQLLNEALQIGMTVRQELEELDRR